MQPSGYPIIAAAALCLALTGPGFAQDATEPAQDPVAEPEAASPDAPATSVTVPETPANEEPATDAPATDAEAQGASSVEPPEAAAPDADTPDADPAEDGMADPGAAETGAAETDGTGGPAAGEGTADAAADELREVTRGVFDDWEVRCLPETEDCFLYQLALDPDGNPVAEFSLLRLPASGEATAGATVVTPLGTLLTSGVVLQIDSGAQRQYPFGWCSQVGCFSRFGLDDEAIGAMKRGRTGELTIVSVADPEAPISVPLSLTGFTAAFDSLELPN